MLTLCSMTTCTYYAHIMLNDDTVPIMLTLCSMTTRTYYAHFNADTIGIPLTGEGDSEKWACPRETGPPGEQSAATHTGQQR